MLTCHLDPDTETVRKDLSLKALKRLDADVVDIVKQSTFVSTYHLNHTAKRWERADVEGFLHIVVRSSQPTHRLMILNQRHERNLVEDVTEHWEMSTQPNYIFYRVPEGGSSDGNKRVSGLWFFDDNERLKLFEALSNITSNLRADARCSVSQPSNNLHSDNSSNTGDLGKTPGASILALLKSLHISPPEKNADDNYTSAISYASNRGASQKIMSILRREPGPDPLDEPGVALSSSEECSVPEQRDNRDSPDNHHPSSTQKIPISQEDLAVAIRNSLASPEFALLVWNNLSKGCKP